MGAVSAIEANINRDSKWVYSAFSLATVAGEDVQKGGASWFAYNYFSAHYRLDFDSKLSFRAPFTYSSAGFDEFNKNENQKQQVNLDDFIVDYTNFNLAFLPGEIEVYYNFRTSLPTSESARAQKKIADFRNEFIFTKGLAARWDLEYWPKFTWFLQTQTAYINEGGGVSNTKRFQLDHRLTVYYRANQKVNLGWFVGGDDDWYNRSSVNNTSRMRFDRLNEHSLKTGPAVRWSAGKGLNFIANISNVVPLWGFADNRKGELSDLGTFKGNQTEFTLLTFLSF